VTHPGLLRVEGLVCRFGGLVAVDGLSLVLGQGQLMGLIGPNGAGKTTVFNLLAGAVRPTAGRIFYRDHDITGHKAHRINRLGLARTFQNIRLFGELSALDNVLVGFHGRLEANFLSAILRLPGYVAAERRMLDRAAELLDLVGLGGLQDERAGNLAYGQQRLLEIARALATRPCLLLLDEPAAGMNPQETAQLAVLVRRLRDELGLTILLIEHDMHFVMNLCETLVVLDHGKVIARGDPARVRRDPGVVEAYLGAEVDLDAREAPGA